MEFDQECKLKQEDLEGRDAVAGATEQSASVQQEVSQVSGSGSLTLSRVKSEGSMEMGDEEPLPVQSAQPLSPAAAAGALSPSPDGGDGSQSSTGSEEILPDPASTPHSRHGLGHALPLDKVDVGGVSLHHDAAADPDPLELDEAGAEAENEAENEAEGEPVLERKERTTRLRRTATRQPAPAPGALSEDSYDDCSSSEEEEMRKTIMIGGAYQAVVPEGFTKYSDKPYKQTDKLLWEPRASLDIDAYLQSTQRLTELADLAASADGGGNAIDLLPMGAHIRDDEQALFLLMQCGHSVEEALRRWRADPTAPAQPAAPPAAPPASPDAPWTDEECRNFENGILTYGKDFHTIQAQKLKTRTVSEIVQFYYLWKKTERHDVFANKMRPEKKKYMLHPGVTLVVYELLDKENQKEAAAAAAAAAASKDALATI